jgi:uncharacterized membrane protein YjgN (DUF898 family)
MMDIEPGAESAPARTLHTLEFRGSGGEYFRIWIVNIALTVITLGIYSAWAKVRTVRYFRGNTFLDGHPFDYHASPVRILIGRAIAVTMLIAYGVSANVSPILGGVWALLFLFILPWLVVSSLRFNARNTSYRNVRFNFIGTMGEAAKVFILWPFLSLFTLFLTIPLVHRARDYFVVNNHTFGGQSFFTQFSGWSIYRIYLIAFGLAIATELAAVALAIAFFGPGPTHILATGTKPTPAMIGFIFVLYLLLFFVITTIQVIVHAMSMNLALGNTTLGPHDLKSELGPLTMAWIVFTNTVLTLVTLGFFYPWAAVRLARYQYPRFSVLASGNLDTFTADAVATQGAIGEEIANFFDLGISL